MKKVMVLSTFVSNGKIYQRGQDYEIGDVPFEVWKGYGWVEEVNVIGESEIVSVTEGLPPLDETPAPSRKRK